MKVKQELFEYSVFEEITGVVIHPKANSKYYFRQKPLIKHINYPNHFLQQYQLHNSINKIELVGHNNKTIHTELIEWLKLNLLIRIKIISRFQYSHHLPFLLQNSKLNTLFHYKIIDNTINNLQTGDIILYYQEKQENKINKIITIWQNMIENIIIFNMQKYFNKIKIKNIIWIQRILEKIVQTFKNNIQEIAKNNNLKFININTNRKKLKKNEIQCPKFGIQLRIFGHSYKFIQFYFDLQAFFHKKIINIISVEEIICCKLSNLQNMFPNLNLIPLNEQTIALIDYNDDSNDLMKKLKTGTHILTQSDGFTAKQLEQLNKPSCQKYMKNRHIQIEDLQYENKKILYKSDKQNSQLFKAQIRQYLIDYKKKVTKCCFIRNKFEMQLFIRYYKQQISNEYEIEFKIKNESLYRRNKTKDQDEVANEVKNIWRNIMKKVIKFPSLKPLPNKPYLNTIIKPIEYIEDSLQHTKYSMQKYNLHLLPHKYYQQITKSIVYVIDHDFKECQSFLEVAYSCQINLVGLKNETSKKWIYLKEYFVQNDPYRQSLLIWYIDSSFVKNYQIIKHLDSLLNKFKQMQPLMISFPYHEKTNRLCEKIMPVILDKFNNFSTDNPRTAYSKELILFHEDSIDAKLQLKRHIQHYPIKNYCELYLPLKSIQQIERMNYFTGKYYEQGETKTMENIQSYLINYERNKSSMKNPIIFMLPDQLNKRKLVINMIEEEVITFNQNPNSNMSMKKLNQTSVIIQQFITLVKEYFCRMNYCLVYCSQYENTISDKLYMLKKNEQSLNAYKIKINNNKFQTESQILYYKLIKNNYLEWFMLQFHQNDADQINIQ